jgi:hypothetical protein
MPQPAKEPLDPERTRYQIGRDAAETEEVGGERRQKIEGCADVWIEGCKGCELR